MGIFKRVVGVYVMGFLVSWLWEVLHSVLYLNYMGAHITWFVLFRAALFDAVIILILVFVGRKLGKYKTLFILFGGFIIAVAIEIWAFKTGRWEYSSLMPIIPIIKTGLTPTIQLAVTAYFVEKITKK
ncbi:MAG: hypothetical protein Q8Q48_03620 [Candidatus Staskawiczbacteria bacterium]|nr:hypothetical protein [Candidatus Staskawiczbacteria bacterium]